MVTTRAGSRAGSEVASTPSKPKAAATDSSHPTPIAGSNAVNAALLAHLSATKRRRARQRERSRILRGTAHGVDPSVASLEPKLTTAIRKAIRVVLDRVAEGSTACPSRVARDMHATDPVTYSDWPELMGPIRAVMWEQAEKGVVEVTAGGIVLESPAEVHGPIRIRKGGKYW